MIFDIHTDENLSITGTLKGYCLVNMKDGITGEIVSVHVDDADYFLNLSKAFEYAYQVLKKERAE